MKPTDALITLARRYCNENYEFWCNEYANKRTGSDFPYTYSDNDYNLFPRYNILRGILFEVEMLLDENFSSLDDCRDMLILAGQISSDVIGGWIKSGKNNDIEILAMQEERDKFAEFVMKITEYDMEHVEPLPYRRSLANTESERIRSQLQERWNFDGSYWEPLVPCSPKPFCFLTNENITASDYRRIKEWINDNAIGRLYKLSEGRTDYQIDLSLFEPEYCYEIIYCDESFNWIVYGSHESTLAFGSEEIVSFVRTLYQGRQELINLLPEDL